MVNIITSSSVGPQTFTGGNIPLLRMGPLISHMEMEVMENKSISKLVSEMNADRG
jgi:hypothetical protein